VESVVICVCRESRVGIMAVEAGRGAAPGLEEGDGMPRADSRRVRRASKEAALARVWVWG
jgi:hypothetical protein